MEHLDEKPRKTHGYEVRAKDPGGRYKRVVLVVHYLPRKGAKARLIRSNHPRYQKEWKSADDITEADKQAFRDFVDFQLSHADGGGSRHPITPINMQLPSSRRKSPRSCVQPLNSSVNIVACR